MGTPVMIQGELKLTPRSKDRCGRNRRTLRAGPPFRLRMTKDGGELDEDEDGRNQINDMLYNIIS
ncbi:hypothetical protein EI77_03045 [Prosthecobacter fusiformis]|uniref:Uncharacterized protein n=1 Tax=Prosthecobacter fusiformis TaxID=48464 RepID=A0A4R7RUH4_9BACT|nr:hypothetical protein EI77_03045 [Prosthecobacter fusiformis]